MSQIRTLSFLFSFILLFSCTKEKDLSTLKQANVEDFASFLTSKPYKGIDSSSYEFGKSTYWYSLFEEEGRYTWDGQDWHRDTILPLWKEYKIKHNLISEKELIREHFKKFLGTKPFPGIDKKSYSAGDDDFYLSLFEETGQYTWLGQEWHRDNVLPLWKKYKLDNNIKTARAASKDDFAKFLASKPFDKIDSSSYGAGQDQGWFTIFQGSDPSKWIGNEWHRDNVLPRWNDYKQKNSLK